MTIKYQFSECGRRFSIFAMEKSGVCDTNRIFGSHSDFPMIVSPYYISERFESYGSLSLSQGERNKLDRLKVRQGFSFLDEAVTQMEGLFMTLSIVEPEIKQGVSWGGAVWGKHMDQYFQIGSP